MKNAEKIDKFTYSLEKYISSEVEKLFTKVVRETTNKIKASILEQDIVATKALYKSVNYKIQKVGDVFIAKIFAGVPYAMAVENGTRKHFPPVNSIADWITVKGARKGHSFTVGFKKQTLNQVAFLIARAISKKGTPAKKFFDLAFRDMDKRVNKLLEGIEL